jgi:hypothetical protein
MEEPMTNEELHKALEGYENHQLLDVLRDRGLVVVAFCAEDVISNQLPDELDGADEALLGKAQEWLVANGKYLEDAMTERGNDYLSWAPNPITL